MSMEHFRRVAQLWNWLPGFRAVAEHDSLHKAAAALGVSPSALSRTVKLLEDNLGAPLFSRHPTGLRLTRVGSQLLAHTRSAMRLVHDAIEAQRGAQGDVPSIRLGVTSGLAATVVVRALTSRIAGGGRVDIIHIAGDAGHQVAMGNLDGVVGAAAIVAAELRCELVATARSGIYAAADHPLAARAGRLEPGELARASFVTTTAEPWSSSPTPGPTVVTCDSVALARLVCESTALLAVLPDAAMTGSGPRLVRIADAHETPLYLTWRRAVGSAEGHASMAQLLMELRAST